MLLLLTFSTIVIAFTITMFFCTIVMVVKFDYRLTLTYMHIIYIHMYTHPYAHTYIATYIDTYVHTCTYTCISTYVYTCIHTYICAHMYICYIHRFSHEEHDTVCFVNPGYTETKTFINNNIMNKIHKSLILIKRFTPFVITVTQ